ncbi:MAG TPA: glycosyltransferase [Candidatus Saccharimonadales bacterium]|nr:glycosyltransferase [Candidatus Saccharimonadales bacterium]
MRFSIITPSFRSGRWLKLCIASVADQGVDLEHIVQDSVSDDGTLDWLREDRRVVAVVEKDEGMYDAVNRGWRRATGEICAYLNCDEQYLPGGLRAAEQFFTAHPEVDVVFADAIVVDSDGRYICHRPALVPTRYHSMVTDNLAILTCATFIRRRALEREGLYFDPHWRVVGDAVWVLGLIDKKVRMATLRQVVSVFTDTGENLSLKPSALRERLEMIHSAPWWAQRLHSVIRLKYRLRKLAKGLYDQKPGTYAIYTHSSAGARVEFKIERPTARWTGRMATRV